MIVNEVITRCRTDQSVNIYYEGKFIEGTVFELVEYPQYRYRELVTWSSQILWAVTMI